MLDKYELLGWALDFEGCISIYRHSNGCSLNSRVNVVTTSCEHLQHFQKRLGIGMVNPEPRRHDKSNDDFIWLLTVAETKEHLPHVLPFLFLKRRQAECVIQFLGSQDPNEREQLFQEVQLLNLRVVRKRTPAEEMYHLLRKR